MPGSIFGSLLRSLPGIGDTGSFLPQPPVVPPSPRPPVRPPDPGCGTLPVTSVPEVPSVKQVDRVSRK